MYYDWNEKTLARLQEYWKSGLSATQIGSLMGITRSAVLGKILRERGSMDFPRRPRPKLPPRPRRMATPKLPPIEPIKPPTTLSVHIMELSNRHCRFPAGYGDDGLMLYCGSTKEQGIRDNGKKFYSSSFCPYHAGIAYSRLPSSAIG